MNGTTFAILGIVHDCNTSVAVRIVFIGTLDYQHLIVNTKRYHVFAPMGMTGKGFIN